MSDIGEDVESLRNRLERHLKPNREALETLESVLRILHELKEDNRLMRVELSKVKIDNERLQDIHGVCRHICPDGREVVHHREESESNQPSAMTEVLDPRCAHCDLSSALVDLQAKFNHLLHEKGKASKQYEADYKKWRNFKKWLLRDDRGDGKNLVHRAPGLPFVSKTARRMFTPPINASGFVKPSSEVMSNAIAPIGDQEETNDVIHDMGMSILPSSKSDTERIPEVQFDHGTDQDISLIGANDPRVRLPILSRGEVGWHLMDVTTVHSSKQGSDHDKLFLAREKRRRTLSSTSRESMESLDEESAKPSLLSKRRGRYPNTENNTINSLYCIDSSKNSGCRYQFNDVVRNQDDRKQLVAGDCECCRDYYEAIQPLPPRLQPPLWRTPTKKLKVEQSCSLNEVHQHKQQISKHRQRWEPPKTPPGYWNIGFPDTPEAATINEQAKSLHEQKKTVIIAEANKNDGRYKRR